MAKETLDNKSIAHELLVELLVHQFAFPVRWVDTQDALFSGQKSVSRLVELGPSKILTGMGQKTMKRKITTGEKPLDALVQFLASTQDTRELYYEYDAPQILEEEPIEQKSTSIQSTLPVTVETTKSSAPSPSAPIATVSIEDVPLSGEEIVRSLVARKLKKPIPAISTSSSIKELCGGKSTLQNELIGDFYNEFSTLPEKPEDIPIKELGAAATGADPEPKLGKTSSALIARLVSSKMPARFNDSAIRKYLSEKWGVGSSRQSAVLVFALAYEPTSRVASTQAAELYWDDILSKYAELCGVTLQVRLQKADETASTTQMVDSKVLAEFDKSLKKMATKQLRALAEYLHHDTSNPSSIPNSDSIVSDLQQKLDTLTTEFSEDFISGILPKFDPRKTRRYNSWWNNVRQDVLGFYQGVGLKRLAQNQSAFEAFTNHIRNRADDRLLTMSSVLAQQMRFNHKSIPGFDHMSQQLEQAILLGAKQQPKAIPVLPPQGPQVIITDDGSIKYTEVPRSGVTGPIAYVHFLSKRELSGRVAKSPFVALRSVHPSGPKRSEKHLTAVLLKQMETAIKSGMSWEKKTILVTGAGQDSIGAEVVRLLLAGGASIIVTTSREPSTAAKYFQRMYEEHGSKGSELHLIQCNQASAKDCEQLIDYIYDSNAGLGRDLDAVLPFAAASEGGIEVDGVAAKSELMLRLMLVNVLRLIGRVIKCKRDRGIDCHPTQILIPLSPNHGTFGGDGLYAESKLGLESLFNRVKSESWSNELSICGLKIGWTRSTGLMTGNDIVSEAVEKHGVLTFSSQEMAFNIALLLTQEFLEICEEGPIEADFGGGLGALEDCHAVLSKARREINLASDIAKATKLEDDHEKAFLRKAPFKPGANKPGKPRSKLTVGFPHLPSYRDDVEPLSYMQGMKDPSSAVVVVGFSELGPWGNSRLRWEVESQGKLTTEGYIEMAWLMNLIQHFDGQRKDGYYVGWVDTKTGEPVCDSDIQQKYEHHITEHTGIRLVESDTIGYDPNKKEFLQEIAIDEDLPELEVSTSTAEALKLRHGNNVTISQTEGSKTCHVQIKSGASIMIPKAVPFPWGSVAGQFPTGWNPAKYGIPEDLIHQVDPVTLYTICCVSEAFYSAGITDPLEIFKYIHLSEIGNFIGSSMGGALKTRNLYRDTYLDKEVQADILQDTYLNTTAAWINMLLLGSTGPIKTPVGACATGVESIDSAFESILAGKTKMCLVGGYDDLLEEESFGFSKMKATVNVSEELARGRLPSEMSRPTAESRAGFVESYGCGVQILCRADVALEMGLPIYGIIAGSAMAADKIGRSVPAPGQGILSFAKESADPSVTSLLDLSYRRNNVSHTSIWSCSDGVSGLGSDYAIAEDNTPPEPYSWTPATLPSGEKINQGIYGTHLISPLRGALAEWGLTVDDLDVASLHGTSTKANDVNEPDVICKQMTHLGRTAGRPLWAVCQKSVTGHPKAPAAAWMLNGCLQVLDTGLVPGNRNADNVDPALREFHHLCFPTRTVQTKGIKAFILTSFGFGQKGGQVVGVAPKFLFATLTLDEFNEYSRKTKRRQELAERKYVKALMANKIVVIQEHSPYDDADASKIFLDPLSRISDNGITGSYRFNALDLRNAPHREVKRTTYPKQMLPVVVLDAPAEKLTAATERSKAWIEERIRNNPCPASTVGIDVVELSAFTAHDNPVFLERNFTEGERRFAKQSLDLRAALASRWCAKEAVFKCLHVPSKGAGAAMDAIEITSNSGIPKVVLHGDAMMAARNSGIVDIQLSLSYGEDCVIAVALGVSRDKTRKVSPSS